MSDRPVCRCHGVAMLFHRDSRYLAGGFYSCRVKNRVRCHVRYRVDRDRRLQKLRDRYDSDPVYRISKRLTDDARSRAKTIERKREAL